MGILERGYMGSDYDKNDWKCPNCGVFVESSLIACNCGFTKPIIVKNRGNKMSIQELIEKGIINTCDKHGAELIYFDATQECPVCKVVIQSKPLNKKKLPTSLVKKEPVKEEETIEEPKGFLDKFKAMPTKKKVILIGVAVGIMWLAMNVNSIMSYFK